jgi:hypothetical protein
MPTKRQRARWSAQFRCPDELLGVWSKYDDGSGLLALWGWELEFRADGTGQYRSWGSPEVEDPPVDFTWRRRSPTQLELRTADAFAPRVINYRISAQRGSYGRWEERLVDSDEPPTSYSDGSFWGSPEPLYRPLRLVSVLRRFFRRR